MNSAGQNSLASQLTSRDNNYNLLRLGAAFLVFVEHCYVLSLGGIEHKPVEKLLGKSIGDIAVDIFFFTSGLLITCSLFSRGPSYSFAISRLLRIYPALITTTILTALVLGPIVTTLPVHEYFSNLETYIFLIKNSLLLAGVEHSLPGVFTSLPYAIDVNGSLWTLPYEIRLYLALFSICLFLKIAKFPQFQNLALVTATIILYSVYATEGSGRLYLLFFIGSTAFILKDKIQLSGRLFAIAFCTLLASLTTDTFVNIAYPITLSYSILFLAHIPKGKVRNFNKIGDYSYGLYILSFPIQQTIMHFFPSSSPTGLFLFALPPSILIAMASWHFLEKRCLQLKPQSQP